MVPLLTGGGSPLKFVEALAYGLPVVATPHAAAGLEAARAGEHYLEADGPEAFADALADILEHGAPDLASRGRALAESNYSIEALTPYPRPSTRIGGRKLKIVSVMTTTAEGGAEFAAMEMLWALEQRGHEAVMLTDLPAIGRDTGVRCAPLTSGPKLSGTDWLRVGARWPQYLMRLRARPRGRVALRRAARSLQEGAADGAPAAQAPARRPLVWAEWGPVPVQMRQGPGAWAYRDAAEQGRHVMAISAGTKDSVDRDGRRPARRSIVVPNVMRGDELAYTEEGRRRACAASSASRDDAFVVGCISRFHPKKRNDVVVEAVKQLDDRASTCCWPAPARPSRRCASAPHRSTAARTSSRTPGDDVADVHLGLRRSACSARARLRARRAR